MVLKNVPIKVYSQIKYSWTIHQRPAMKFAKPMDSLRKFNNLAPQDNSENFKPSSYVRLKMVTFHKVVA